MNNTPPKPGFIYFDVVAGVEGHCLTVGDSETSLRLAGPKPWGGGTTIHRFCVSVADLRGELDAKYGKVEDSA